MRCKPPFELCDTVRVLKSCDFPGFRHALFDAGLVVFDDPLDKGYIDPDPAVADRLVNGPEPLFPWDRPEPSEPLKDCLLRDNILLVVLAEKTPAVRVILWHIPAAPAVRFRWCYILAKILDERLACFQFLLILWEPECLARVFQRPWKSER